MPFYTNTVLCWYRTATSTIYNVPEMCEAHFKSTQCTYSLVHIHPLHVYQPMALPALGMICPHSTVAHCNSAGRILRRMVPRVHRSHDTFRSCCSIALPSVQWNLQEHAGGSVWRKC